MVARLSSAPAVLEGDVEPTDGTVEPVEGASGGDATAARERHYLRLRVAALEGALARARRRRALVVEQYERALERRDATDAPARSWRD